VLDVSPKDGSFGFVVGLSHHRQRTLVIDGHPDPESFVAARREADKRGALGKSTRKSSQMPAKFMTRTKTTTATPPMTNAPGAQHFSDRNDEPSIKAEPKTAVTSWLCPD